MIIRWTYGTADQHLNVYLNNSGAVATITAFSASADVSAGPGMLLVGVSNG